MRDYNSEFGYQPYTGGAGPTEDHVQQLNETLFNAAKAAGLNPKLSTHPDYGQVVSVGELEVSYDRWGYCADGTELDQTDLNEVIAYLTQEVEA